MKEELKKKMTPQKAIDLLRQDGIEVDEQQATLLIDFMLEIAEIAVDQYLASKKKN